ncbi:MAG TPA: alpha/beta fold hydrolase [Tepidisphaeraceae bacterium]|jgi:alpha-beta hydrolase superfamily lysophospholipase|nr:alpha/beta fold hydrolase [Tepidisphaeraceae bacterium]
MLPLSILIPRLYVALPVAAMTLALARSWRGKSLNPFREFFVGAFAGAVGGLVLVLIYGRGSRGHIPATQIAIACYWGISVGCVLRGAGAALAWSFDRALGKRPVARARSNAPQPTASVFRAMALVAIIVPYVGAMVLTYRPHIIHPGTPRSILKLDYQDITFLATDGVRLRGWWIPAAHTSRSDDTPPSFNPGDRTVILCHGFGADKASDLRMARDLAPNGYNILAFDFRAHGESDGQLTTFGDEERRDVIGAVRWARRVHPEQTRKIFGLGESLGAAALIGAAADPDEGQFIDAVAVFAPFDRLSTLVQDVADAHFSPTAGWMATHLALPVAGAQLGCDLQNFAPAASIDKLAPRPLLVIASDEDIKSDIDLSKDLYERASQPKFAYWIKKGDRHTMLFAKEKASLAVRVFFETARNVL